MARYLSVILLIVLIFAGMYLLRPSGYVGLDKETHTLVDNVATLHELLEEQNITFINGISYRRHGNVLAQLTEQKDILRFGVLSDIHGAADHAAYFVDFFLARGVDAFLVPGDTVDHFRNAVPDLVELEEVLSLLSAPGLPVFLIPGNHETKDVYYGTLAKLGRKNIIDMTSIRRADLGVATIISLPGYNLPAFVADGGFFFDGREWLALTNLSSNALGLRILLSHQIPRSTRSNGIDAVFSGEHVGDATLVRVMNDSQLDVSVGSHIHEAGGQAETRDGLSVAQQVFSKTLYLNPGSVAGWSYRNRTLYKGMAALVTVNGTHAAYEMILLS